MPIEGEIGGIKKKTLLIGAVATGGLVVVVVWMRTKSSATQSTANQASVTDPAGNVCAALDPNSGYCPGTPQDLEYQSQMGTALGTDSSSYVGGQVIGYDQYGNPIYSSSAPVTGPGSYVNNAEWAQAAESYIIQEEPNADPGTVGAALGAYIEGQQVSSDQRSIIEQAIAFQGSPPVPGPNGDPPNINEASTPTGTTTTTTSTSNATIAVPKVEGLGIDPAEAALTNAGLVPKLNTAVKGGTSYVIISQTPGAGTKVKLGSRVDLAAGIKK